MKHRKGPRKHEYTYHKNPKISDIRKFAVITLKVEQLFLRVMHPKDAEGIANSIDPDQLEEQSDQGLHCLPRPVCPKTYGMQFQTIPRSES